MLRVISLPAVDKGEPESTAQHTLHAVPGPVPSLGQALHHSYVQADERVLNRVGLYTYRPTLLRTLSSAPIATIQTYAARTPRDPYPRAPHESSAVMTVWPGASPRLLPTRLSITRGVTKPT